MKPVVTGLRVAVLLLVFALVAAASGWAQSEQQQSLGDLARKQREKKGQETQKGTKVLTNEDLPHSGGLSSSGSSSATASSSAGAEGQSAADAVAAEGETKAAPEGEASDMTKAQQADEAREKLEALKADEAATERGIKRYEEMVANETDESRRELYQRALRNAQGNLAVVQKQRAEAEKEAAGKGVAAQDAQQKPPPQ